MAYIKFVHRWFRGDRPAHGMVRSARSEFSDILGILSGLPGFSGTWHGC
jgi:hypothetical protein